ncbi:methyltransferase [Streptomyces sp. NPDC090442]|uniref:methyltransferase n=1 Tax=Streptomyces sp. NPDC090442 TaxID=3365962 RepID=UPI00381091EA
MAGDFFATAPEGADVYLLKSVLHDWNDEQCFALRTVAPFPRPNRYALIEAEPV